MNRPALLALTLSSCTPLLFSQTAQDEFFEKKIRPVLAKNCQGCHNAKVKMAELNLSSAEGFTKGGASGALVAGDTPEKSLILQVTNYEGRLKMPPTGKLKVEELADLTTWVKAGAPWPGAAATPGITPAAAAKSDSKWSRQLTEQEKKFWAFQPVRLPGPPPVKDTSWIKSPIDRFILAKLEERGLKPAPPANKLALLRRVTFDLTGLPPTPEEIETFLGDDSANAFEKVVDRLLASPRYGEQWGRHWLDVARYADSTGNDEDHRYPYAWRYRDYVIDAFNEDIPYDRFVREQIAGDLMPAPDGGLNRRGIVATGFLALGAKAIAQQDKQKMLYDVYDEQVDVTSKAILGVTIACARCHDHKFDPFLTRDYYSLISIFASTKSFKDPSTHVSKLLFTPLAPKEEFEKYTQFQAKLTHKNMEIEDVVDGEMEKYTSQLVPRTADYMLAAHRVYHDNADAAAIAREQNLREDVLRKWAKYLKPSGDARVHLEDWVKASPGKMADVAKAFQASVEKHAGEWNKSLAAWRAQFRKMTAEMNMPPPARPKFEADTDRFFYEVYFDKNGPFAAGKGEREKIFSEQGGSEIAKLQKEQEELKKIMPPEPDMACAVEEGPPVQQKIFIRGDYNALGPEAPKSFPVVLAGYEQPRIAKGSGRLEFADWLTRRDNPLTARVMVNRVWEWHFGEGIVRTPDNFGKMGDRPTHPELLDYLAGEFMRNGWSVKKLHKTILLSNAYRTSSDVPETSMKADPENKLISRFPRRRLTVEELRDGLLAMDGSLDVTMGGTLQTGFGTDGENSNDRLSIKPETNKRRMVYLPLRRANLPTLLNLYDFGDATTPTGKRALTTVAPQALFMMNSEFIAARAKNLSSAALKDPAASATARLRKLYLRILNREPRAEELDAGVTYIERFQKKFAPKRAEMDAWFSLSRVLIASNEFIYLD